MVQKNISKKKIKRMLRNSGNQKCPRCNSKLSYGSGDDERWFLCSDTGCNYYLQIHKDTPTLKDNYYNDGKDHPENNEEVEDEEKTLFIIDFKLRDEYYELKDNLKFNPVTKMVLYKNSPKKLNNLQVDKLLDILYGKLKQNSAYLQ